VAELLKPVTWFPPMWAFACGVVSSGVAAERSWLVLALGLAVTGPLVCATSQAANDWFDREVDRINEPDRPIPSGRIPGRWGLYIALLWTTLSLLGAVPLGRWGFIASGVALVLAWLYSAPPFRLKQNGWIGNAAVAFSYEGLAWFTGAAVALGGRFPPLHVVVLAVAYSVGAHGIMTLNDFKSIRGDRLMGVGSLPAMLGRRAAAWVAVIVMAAAQVTAAVLLWVWGFPLAAWGVVALLLLQAPFARRLLAEPDESTALLYSAAGVPLYVTGMMVSAFAVRGGLG